MTEARRSAFAAEYVCGESGWHASFHEAIPLAAFAAVDIPTLLLSGTKSTAPARAMTRLLSSVLPHAKIIELEGMGHMGPVTHPEVVNSAIETFLLEDYRSP